MPMAVALAACSFSGSGFWTLGFVFWIQDFGLWSRIYPQVSSQARDSNVRAFFCFSSFGILELKVGKCALVHACLSVGRDQSRRNP